MRSCPRCGEPEKRAQDRVNLEPVSGLCISCLIVSTKGPRPMPDLPVDWAKRAAADED